VTGETHEYVLTLFERLTTAQLPFYLRLMKHLAAKGLPVPDPPPTPTATWSCTLEGKPAAVVNRLRGAQSQLAPTARALRQQWAPCWRACTWPGATFPLRAAQSARPGLVERDRAGGAALPDADQAALLRASWPSRTTWPPGRLRRAAPRPHPRRPVPRQRAV
jgi:hypothetical protein